MKQEYICEFSKEEYDLYNRIMNKNDDGNANDTNKIYVCLGSTYPEYRNNDGKIYLSSCGPEDKRLSITFYRNLEMRTDTYYWNCVNY